MNPCTCTEHRNLTEFCADSALFMVVALTNDDFDLKFVAVESVAFPVYMALWAGDASEFRLVQVEEDCQEYYLHQN